MEDKKKKRNERDKKLFSTNEDSRLKRQYTNLKGSSKKFITEVGRIEDLLFLQELLEERLKNIKK